MERRLERSKLEQEKEALRNLVKQNDSDWDKRFTELGDYDRIFQRITSLPNWLEDRQLVEMFIIVRRRKRLYFCETYVEEDAVIVPNVSQDIPKPCTEGLSEPERRLTILVHNFLSNPDRHQMYKEAYNRVYRQFETISGWKHNPVLAKLHKDMKACEAANEQSLDYIYQQGASERLGPFYDQNAMKIDKEIQVSFDRGELKKPYLINMHLRTIHVQHGWSKKERLLYWHRILVDSLRILQANESSDWKSKIVGLTNDNSKQGPEQASKKGLLERIWEGIRPYIEQKSKPI